MGWSTTQAAWTLGLLALLGARAGRAESIPSPLAARDAAAALVAVSGAELRWRPETGVAARVRLPLTGSGDLAPAPAGTPLERRLESFFAAHGAVFGVRDASSELHRASTWQDEQGFTHLVLDQFHRGLPVPGGQLRAHFDPAGRLREVSGVFVPDIPADLRLDPQRTSESAAATARTWMTARHEAGDQRIASGPPRLVVYRPGLGGGPPAAPRLAWRIEAGNGGDLRALIFVDDRTGKVVDEISLVPTAMLRRAYSGIDQAPYNGIPDSWPESPDWVEGDSLPTGARELDAALAATADVWRFFAFLGLDSWDGLGHELDISWNHATGCPNASWNGRLASFCSGFAVHDVVAHEWAHAWTQRTHGLIYRWQSGALNESYSDLWGELLDDATHLTGVRDTDGPDAPRADGACSEFLEARLRIGSPASLAGDHPVGLAAFGPPPPADPPARQLVRVRDTSGGPDACEPVTNPAEVAGRIAFADRGACDFQIQARHAQQAGAVGLVIGNLPDSPDPDLAPAMGCDPVYACDLDLAIPTVSVAAPLGEALRVALTGWVGGRILRGHNEGPGESVRWLLGEDIRPFGVTRDMWTPTCFGDPGKVSDPEYQCSSADNGGVHRNSGVPNHAFALLVDGGTYNGRTITAIGRTRALHVYWRAQRVYQTPAADFPDHAAALESACDDLIGSDLPDPFGGPAVRLRAADCAQVEAAVAAVELRTVNPCGYPPILASPAPPICPGGAAYTTTLFGFETGNEGWSVSRRDVADPATFDPRDWTRRSGLPDQRAGHAFYAPDPLNGYCVTGEGDDDESGVLVLQSPLLRLPIGLPPRLAFDHWIASELDWDGGNVKISVDGGPFELLPPDSYRFNPPNGLLFEPNINTNPLAGEPAFHGTDTGSNDGSWGRSIVDLSGRVVAGVPFRLRFEFGTDICFGNQLGWWVDDVRLAVCTGPSPVFVDGFDTGGSGRWSRAEL